MEREMLVETPQRLRHEMHAMSRKTVEMLKLTGEGFRKQDKGPLQAAEMLGREIHQQEKVLTELAITTAGGQAHILEPDRELFFIPLHLERIGDNIELLIRTIKTMLQEGIPFTERAMREVNTLFERAIELVECVRDLLPTQNTTLLKHVIEDGRRYEALADTYALTHQQRLIEGVCMPKASSLFVAMLDYFKGIEWHTRQIAQKLATIPTYRLEGPRDRSH